MFRYKDSHYCLAWEAFLWHVKDFETDEKIYNPAVSIQRIVPPRGRIRHRLAWAFCAQVWAPTTQRHTNKDWAFLRKQQEQTDDRKNL